ncbi:MAG: glycosyltransferase family 2 protein [Candidatus Limnocylindria bacterium]
MPPVSACVIARDDALRIERCLASLAWADETVVVIDERSCDGTEELARRAGARALRHAYHGNVEQKNFALDQAKHDWVVALDADEALSPALAARLRERLAGDPSEPGGFELGRVTRHLGRWIRHGDFHPDWQLRVFRRSRGRWAGSNPHGRVRLVGRVERIEGDLEHASYTGLADQVARVQEYSRVEALELHRRGRRARVSDLVLRPPARFLRAYLLKAGFLDGMPGFLIAAITAFHVLLKYAKLWELERSAGRDARGRG